jgi:hypothetical protein
MNADIFAEWLRRQGHRVVRTESSCWFDAAPRVYQSFPYHLLIQPSQTELDGLLRGNRAVALRYSTPAGTAPGCMSYHVVLETDAYDIDALDRRTRQNVRAGLGKCRVEPIPLERLAEEGYELERDTAARQGRGLKTSREEWRNRCLAACGLEGFEAWGALVESRLAATILAFRMHDCCELLSQQCHSDFIDARVNHALVFTVTRAMVGRPGISSIFYTLQSLDAPPSVDEFKYRMGYTAKPVRQRVVFHPWLAPMVRPVSYRALRRLRDRRPASPTLPKLAGMVRFYLELTPDI